MKRSQWRTFAGILTLGAMMLIALGVCRSAPNGPAMLSSVVTGLGGLGLFLAGKSGWQAHVESNTIMGVPEAPKS